MRLALAARPAADRPRLRAGGVDRAGALGPAQLRRRPRRGRLAPAGARSRTGASRTASATAAALGSAGATRAPGAGGFGTRGRGSCRATRIRRPGAILAGLATIRRRRRAARASACRAPATPWRARLAVRFGSTSGRSAGCARSGARAPFSIAARLAGGQRRAATRRSRGSRTAACAPTASTSRCAAPATASAKPRRLATGRIRGVAAAIGERGDALVAWDARGVLRTRFKPRGRARLPRHGHDPLQARLLRRHAPGRHAERARRAGVERPVRSEGGDSGPVRFQAATRAAGARRFARARLLETIPARAYDGLGRADRRRRRHGGRRGDRLARRRRRARLARRRAAPRRCRRRARPPCSPTSRPAPTGAWSRSGTAASTTARASCAAAVAGGVGQPFGPAGGRLGGRACALRPRRVLRRPARRDRARAAAGGRSRAQAYVR